MEKNVQDQIYPCNFPVKIIGENSENLEKAVVKVMSLLGNELTPCNMTKTHSKNRKYLSITINIIARSREHIDKVYSELNARKEVKMVL